MIDIDLGPLENGPHANLIRDMTRKCYADSSIQAIWVGGSLAAGLGDEYSDVDFRIAVEPGQMDRWTSPDWEDYLPIRPCGSALMRFGEQALLHHMVLADGTIIDFYVQDTATKNSEPNLVILACRDADGFIRRLAPSGVWQKLNLRQIDCFEDSLMPRRADFDPANAHGDDLRAARRNGVTHDAEILVLACADHQARNK